MLYESKLQSYLQFLSEALFVNQPLHMWLYLTNLGYLKLICYVSTRFFQKRTYDYAATAAMAVLENYICTGKAFVI